MQSLGEIKRERRKKRETYLLLRQQWDILYMKLSVLGLERDRQKCLWEVGHSSGTGTSKSASTSSEIGSASCVCAVFSVRPDTGCKGREETCWSEQRVTFSPIFHLPNLKSHCQCLCLIRRHFQV